MGTRFRRFGRASTTLLAAATFTATLTAIPAGAAVGNPSDLVEGCEDAPSASGIFNDYQTLSARQKVVVDCLSSGYKGDKDDSDFVLQGSGSGTARRVNFDQTITRQQFAAILNRVGDYLGLDAASGNPNDPTFADVTSNMFFFNEIEELYARGLTTGKGPDTQDVDNDGDTQELVYDPFGDVTYGQVLAFVYRLLAGPDGAGEQLATNQSRGQANSLDCGFFDDEKQLLDNAGFLISGNTPSDCRAPSPRGLVFDLIAVSFDETVESGLADNPFTDAPGSIDLLLDATSAFTNETVTATVTVLDSEGEPVPSQRVNVFAVASQDGFNGDGSPKNAGTLNLGGSNTYGTGSTPGSVDGTDPLTNASGKVTVTVGATAAGSFDVYAFIGDSGTTWVQAKDVDGEATDKKTVTFSALPAAITQSSTAGEFALKYPIPDNDPGDSHTVTFTMVDSGGNAVQSAGLKIIAELYRRNNNGSETLFAVQKLTTNEQGTATWTPPKGVDPSTGSGDDTTDRFRATLDRNGDDVINDQDEPKITTEEDLLVEWLDAPRSRPGSATITLPSENSAKNDQMGALHGSFSGSPIPTFNPASTLVTVTVMNVYGDLAEGAQVQISRTGGASKQGATGTSESGNPGVVTFTVEGTNPSESHAWSALADTGGNGVFTPGADVAATSVTGDGDVTVHWVGDGSSISTTYSNLLIGGRSSTELFLYGTSTRVRVNHDGGDRFYLGSTANEVSYGTFLATIDADVSANDRIDVEYNPNGGISQWTLTVNDDEEPFPLP